MAKQQKVKVKEAVVGKTYDEAFRTLLIKCKRLIIPVVNEVFGEHFSENDEVRFSQNEHFLTRQGGDNPEKITDSCFTIIGVITKTYLIECQSYSDDSMLIRIFEYSAQIAVEGGTLVKDVYTVSFPNSAILYLRSKKSLNNKATMRIVTPGGTVEYNVMIIKIKDYDLEQIFNKNLVFLLPFYIFTYYGKLAGYERDEEKLQQLMVEFKTIRKHLDNMENSGTLTTYENQMISELTYKVVKALAKNYTKIKKGIGDIMNKGILETKTDQIYQAGWNSSQKATATNLKKMGMDTATIAKALEVTVDQVLKMLDPVSAKVS